MTCFCVHMEMFQRSFPLRESFYCTEEESRLILSVFVCVSVSFTSVVKRVNIDVKTAGVNKHGSEYVYEFFDVCCM